MAHRVPPTFVVSFEKWEEGADFFKDLETKHRHQNGSLIQTLSTTFKWVLSFRVEN